MSNREYIRTIAELESVGCKWWPTEIQQRAYEISLLKTLLDSQERFISLLVLADPDHPEDLFELIEHSTMTYQMFLKHLSILTDVGSEPIQRIHAEFSKVFPDGVFVYQINGAEKTYNFAALSTCSKPTNEKMQTDSIENLNGPCRNVGLMKDLIMLLLYGEAAVSPKTRSVLRRCNMFQFIGQEDRIKKFVRENYIRVSRIINGKTANDMGNALQSCAADAIRAKLGDEYNVVSPGTIPGVRLDDDKEATFDIVIDKNNDTSRFKPYVGIEVSFQETSNSVVERKGREAQARFRKAHEKRCYVAYIIDGVGNFSRTSAANDMCANSDCNVAYTQSEFEILCEFVREVLG